MAWVAVKNQMNVSLGLWRRGDSKAAIIRSGDGNRKIFGRVMRAGFGIGKLHDLAVRIVIMAWMCWGGFKTGKPVHFVTGCRRHDHAKMAFAGR